MNIDKLFNFPLGTQVIIELLSGHMIDGIIDHYNQNFIKVRNCRDHYSGAYLHSKRLYRSQITNILTLDDTEKASLNGGDNVLATTSSSNSTTEETDNTEQHTTSKRILLPKDEYLRLKELTRSFVYMGIIDSRYYEAVDVLKNCETVGMSGYLNGVQNLSILALSSWDKVYVFDIQEFKQTKIPEDLQDILQMSSIQKVSHNGRNLVICLQRNYKIDVQNLFDTQVADFKIKQKQNPELQEFSTLPMNEILSTYLNFPDNTIHKHDVTNWKHRPLDADFRRYAAESVAYLITLKNTLERILLKDFYASVSKYTKTLDEFTDELELSAKFSRNLVHKEEF